ncbi:MAG: phospho-N-acetylmuramoyl-pentapeptide-transferase [Clostridia bacterium]|nr:phospho-N-acetylmuramoyl-pentapeptide-transferase [Clostridia bacterium]
MNNSITALISAALIVILSAPFVIPLLRKLKLGQNEREEGPQSHKVKQGTPSMGGVMIIAAIVIATLIPVLFTCFGDGGSELQFVLPALLVTVAYGTVGFLDDFIKVRMKRNLGLRAYQKLIAQFGIALVFSLYLKNTLGTEIYLPFTNRVWDMGWLYIPFAMFLIIGTVNAVNLTDGLDGLASGVTLVYSMAMAIIFLYIQKAAQTQGEIYIASTGNLCVFSAATAGACLGFLAYNAYPAKVFMGDTGSLALGGAVSVMALMSRSAFLLIIMGFCFLMSALSVILQVGSYKLRNKKRIFKMAPIHHHFELCGMSESAIVAMYMITTAILCLICLGAYIK